MSLVFPGLPYDLTHCMDTASWEPQSFCSADVQNTCTAPGAYQKRPGVQDVQCWAKLSISTENVCVQSCTLQVVLLRLFV